MLVDLNHIEVQFQYQGHWFKVKVILVNSFGMTSLCHSYGHQGQGHLKVKVIYESNCKCFDFYHEAGSGPSTKMQCDSWLIWHKFCKTRTIMLFPSLSLLLTLDLVLFH